MNLLADLSLHAAAPTTMNSSSESGTVSAHISNTPAASSESSSGTLLQLPNPITMRNEPFCLADTDVLRVTQAVAQIIGHSPASQSQANPITVDMSSDGTPLTHEG